MSVKLRFARAGRKKLPFYHIVATDSRNARDGRYIERVGHFNPLTKVNPLTWNVERVEHWLSVGAEPSERVAKLIVSEKVGSEKLRQKLEGKQNYRMKKVQERLAAEKAVVDAAAAKVAAAAAAEAAEAAAAEAAAAAPVEEAPVEAAPAEEAKADDAEKPAE